MKEIYIVLTRSKTLLSNTIYLLSSFDYTHASISFDSNIDEMYSIGRKYTFSSYPAYMKKEYLDKGFFHYHKSAKIGLYSVQVSDSSFIKMKNYVEELFKNNTKLKFSLLGIFYCRIGKAVKRKNKMFCSEFVCSVLKQADEELIDKSPEMCSPMDLLNTKGIKKLYTGKISDLVEIKKHHQLKDIYITK